MTSEGLKGSHVISKGWALPPKWQDHGTVWQVREGREASKKCQAKKGRARSAGGQWWEEAAGQVRGMFRERHRWPGSVRAARGRGIRGLGSRV